MLKTEALVENNCPSTERLESQIVNDSMDYSIYSMLLSFTLKQFEVMACSVKVK